MDAAATSVLRLITLLAPFATMVMVAGHRPSDIVLPLTEWSTPLPSTRFPCGGDYEGTKGTIVSPNYPQDYPAHIHCQWTVTSPDDTIITVHFESFSLYPNNNDYLHIRDGNDISAPLLKKCYSSSCSGFTSTGNSLFFLFNSRNGGARGFYLNWFAGFGYQSCYYCDNRPDSNHYDPACGEDHYEGSVDISDKSLACYTNVHYDGSRRVERGWTENLEENGTCYDSGYSLTCYCKGDHCNNHLCQNCITTTPFPITTTQPFSTSMPPPTTTNTHPYITTTHSIITSSQPPATITRPPTSNQPSTPSGPLQCYSCIDCKIIDGDTHIESSEEFLSCSTAIELGNTHFVVRGGSRDYHEDGACIHEADGLFVCYCTSTICNGDPAA